MPRKPTKPSAPRPRAARATSLAERHVDHTRQWIVEAATALLEDGGATALTNAAIAARAGIAERTVYRHFGTRDALLDEIAAAFMLRLDAPAPPDSVAGLLAYPAALFGCFEARSQLVQAALDSELFIRVRDGQAAERWTAIRRVLDAQWPAATPHERELTAANLRYLLSATTWRYYRQHLGFDSRRTVESVQLALRCLIEGLPRPATRGPSRRRTAEPA